MDWLITSASWIGIVGAFFTVGSFTRLWLVRPRWIPLSIGLILLAVFGFLLRHIANAPPGREPTVIQTYKPDFRNEQIKSLAKTLTMDWHSEDEANWPVTEKLAECCEISYLPPVDAIPALRRLGFDLQYVFLEGSMAGYVGFVEDSAVVIFRGTDDVSDWFVNLDSLTIKTPHGSIHRGFQNSYQTLSDQVLKILRAHNPKRIWITGHSLGGALAVSCAYEIHQSKEYEIAGLATFGQPMLVDQSLANYIDEQFYGRYVHFVNGADIVPRVVPTLKHCGSLVWFKDNVVYRSKPKNNVIRAGSAFYPDEDQSLNVPPLSEFEFRQIKEQFRQANKPKFSQSGEPSYEGNSPYIDDHSMALYLAAIRRTLKPVAPPAPPAPPSSVYRGGIGALPSSP